MLSKKWLRLVSVLITITLFAIPSWVFAEKSDVSELTEKNKEIKVNIDNEKRFRQSFGLQDKNVAQDEISLEAKERLGINLSNREYQELERRFGLIDKAKNAKKKINQKYANSFGGMYYDHNINALIVGVVNGDNALKKEFQSLFEDPSFIQFMNVKYSYEFLIKRKAELDDALNKQEIPYTSTSLSPELNRIILTFENQELLNTYRKVFGADYITFQIEKKEPFIQTAARNDPLRPLEGGAEILTNGSYCTGAFSARDSSGNYFYLTAGHCGPIGTKVSQGGSEIGTITKSVNINNSDAAAITITSTLASSKLYNFGYFDFVPDPTDVVVGEPLCISGRSSGVVCGKVVSADWSMFDRTHRLMGDFSAQAGDSGSPAYYGSQITRLATLFGITSGTVAGNIVITHTKYALTDLGLSNAVLY